jgi:FkbM family methyltransferase
MSLKSFTVETPSGPRILKYRDGTSDRQVIEQVFERGEYAFLRFNQGRGLVDLCVRQGEKGLRPLIIDAGANIGASAVYFALNFPRARIVAIEPVAENFALLKANTEGFDVHCIHGALAVRPGHMAVVDPGHGFWAFRTGPLNGDATDGSVEAVAMNELYARHGDGCFPFLAKIDVEGAEEQVFADRLDWVDQTPVIAIELHDWLMPGKGTSRSFLQCVAARERDFLILGENVFSVKIGL